MGIDLRAGGRVKSTHSKNTKSPNVYRKLLVKLYRFLARRTSAKFNKIILRRLMTSKIHRPVLNLRTIEQKTRQVASREGAIIVTVGTVVDDNRIVGNFPKMTVCALRFSKTARARILAAGGKCMTFDQLAVERPIGQNTILLKGSVNARTATRYFGRAPGTKNSSARPRLGSTSRLAERVTNNRRRH